MRLDQALAERGLARSRSHAKQLIDAGRVRIDGNIAKAADRVDEHTRIDVDGDAWVSRAAYKLVHALDTFAVPVRGRRALDVGASTGGFTQVLLAAGAAHVSALDVGHGQFALEPSDRVTLIEGMNVRDLTPADVAKGIDLVTCDVSFIALHHVLPPVRAVVRDADWIVLVKPQFEVGRTNVKGGIVTDPALHAKAIEGVLAAAATEQLFAVAIEPSPIHGTHGNREYLLHLSAHGRDPAQWTEPIRRIVDDAVAGKEHR